MEVARTPNELDKGLGDRASLPIHHAMLFIFNQPDHECFWMKDMRFPLDIVWLSADKKVTHIEHNISPATYPNSFCPPQPAKYVIEFNAGIAKELGLKANDLSEFK